MTGRLVYVIGVPGAGKSTLLGALLSQESRILAEQHTKPFAHELYHDAQRSCTVLGRQRDQFPGTDTLSMSVQPLVLDWLQHYPYGNVPVVGEGDRLANGKFFRAVAAAGWDLAVVLLDTPPRVAAQRRAARGSAQSEAWLRSRYTKIVNLRPYINDRLEGTQPPEALAATLAGFLWPSQPAAPHALQAAPY